jgi:tetratricopeptide (TPR) repeat protein
MASNVPVVKQVSLLSIVPQVLVMALLMLLFYLLKFDEFLIYGAASFLILVFLLRNLVARSHRTGMRLVKRQNFEAAIPLFQKSVAYFTKNAWVDKYRLFTLMSSSSMSYKEMGLCNIAFCYSQIGNGVQAKHYYEMVLKEFPQNGLAIAGLNMLNAVGQNVAKETRADGTTPYTSEEL